MPRGPTPLPCVVTVSVRIPAADLTQLQRNIVLSHADRSRVIRASDRKRTGYMEGVNFGSVLIDGFVGATWTLKRQPKAATLRIALLDRLPKRERVAVEDEGAQLLSFMAAETSSRTVVVLEPGAKPRTSP